MTFRSHSKKCSLLRPDGAFERVTFETRPSESPHSIVGSQRRPQPLLPPLPAPRRLHRPYQNHIDIVVLTVRAQSGSLPAQTQNRMPRPEED